MKFRPCIDIHNGKVKQIVGQSLTDKENSILENFVSENDASYYADFYKNKNIKGGHIILLNAPDSEFYEVTRQQALSALRTFPGGLQIGGGITAENAPSYIEAGASHVIVTSYVFRDGHFYYENLKRLIQAIGKDKIVLDLSCRQKDGSYYIMTDRWQKYTEIMVNKDSLSMFSNFCDEFLIHAVDVEGKSQGIEVGLAQQLGAFNRKPITYAGGVHSLADLRQLHILSAGNLDVTIGSALDLFGGELKLEDVLSYLDELEKV